MAINPYTGASAPLPLASVPEELQPRALENIQQQRMAQLLMQQGMQEQPQGQMISGHYVKASPYQNLAAIANKALGMYAGYQADKGQLELAKAIRESENAGLADYLQNLQGKPAQAGNLRLADTNQAIGSIEEPMGQYKAPVAALPPNAKMAHVNAATDTRLPAWARQQAITQAFAPPKEFDLSEGGIRYREMPDGTVQIVAKGGEKLHPVKGNLVTSSGKVVYSAPLTGEEKVNPAEAPLRTSFLNQATPHIQISQAYRKIETAPDTAAGDMSKIFGFMKILDPSSTVREGEYASAENARGVPDTVRAQYNKVMSGQRLTPSQRTQFTQAAGDLVGSQKQQFEGQKKFFENIAVKNKIAPESVIYDPYEGLNLQTTPPKAPKQPVNVGQQLGVPQVNNGWNIISVTPTK